MSYPKVGITLLNGALGGLIASADGTMGLLLTGATEGSVTVATPFSLNSLEDLVALGITSASTLNAVLYRQVKAYYAELGGKGLSYWMVVASTVTVSVAADVATAGGVIKLLDFAQGAIRVVALSITPQGSPTIANALNTLTYTAATNLQATLNTYATAQKPLRGIIAADSYSGTAASLTNMKNSTLNRVGILLGDTVATNDGGCVGLLLGRMARVPVQRKVSRVKDGALSSAVAYIGTASADAVSSGEAIHDKGFITIRTITGRNGYFFSSDPTCVANTDDYSTIARGRVIDKAQRIAYQVYINEVDDEVPVNADGTIEAGYAKYLEQLITGQINLGMTAAREISGFRCTIDLAQNVVSTGQVKVVMALQPVGYASDIEVSLGFSATLS